MIVEVEAVTCNRRCSASVDGTDRTVKLARAIAAGQLVAIAHDERAGYWLELYAREVRLSKGTARHDDDAARPAESE